jgi:hypothetical protein
MIALTPIPTNQPISTQGATDPVWVRWLTRLWTNYNNLQGTGTTAQRPNPAPFIGFMYFDTTLNKPIWAKTLTTWVYGDGTAA